MQKTRLLMVFGLIGLLILAGAAYELLAGGQDTALQTFDGQRAYEDVAYQVSLGPRVPGTEAHTQVVDWIQEQAKSSGWEVEVQETEMLGHSVRNIIARWGEGKPWIVMGAHYDSRMVADHDQDPDNRLLPVPGANDGASGVGILLEMARVLPDHLSRSNQQNTTTELVPPAQVWLVFFDAEDNGNLPGWDWILGSRAFVASLEEKPDVAVIVDMIGDRDLNVYQEKNSDPLLTQQIWGIAQVLGFEEQIIPEMKHRILDDHVPFIEAGIPAVDLIDFDYPYWHTREDTLDKVSAESLDVIGETLLAWLTNVNQ